MNQETPAQKKRPKTPVVEAKPVAPDIAYTVSMSKPSTHLLEVDMAVNWSQMPGTLEVKMPVWTPGSYLIREYARHVQGFSAKDGAGAALAWRKINKNTWAVETRSAGAVAISYKAYANELTVRTNELNDEHAFWNNTATLMFIKGQLAAPATVAEPPRSLTAAARESPDAALSRNTHLAALTQALRGDLETIVAKALKKSPAERYATVQELRDDLQRHLGHQPVSAQPDTFA